MKKEPRMGRSMIRHCKNVHDLTIFFRLLPTYLKIWKIYSTFCNEKLLRIFCQNWTWILIKVRKSCLFHDVTMMIFFYLSFQSIAMETKWDLSEERWYFKEWIWLQSNDVYQYQHPTEWNTHQVQKPNSTSKLKFFMGISRGIRSTY